MKMPYKPEGETQSHPDTEQLLPIWVVEYSGRWYATIDGTEPVGESAVSAWWALVDFGIQMTGKKIKLP